VAIMLAGCIILEVIFNQLISFADDWHRYDDETVTSVKIEDIL